MNIYLYKLLNFLLGGTLFITIDYCANELENPDLSALVSLIPISLICGYVIYDLKLLKRHTLATVPYYNNIICCSYTSGFFILI